MQQVQPDVLLKKLPGLLFINISQGGEKQIGVQVENNDIDLVIFLRDPYTAKPHEPDVNIIVLLCDKYNIPLATNLASAELLIKALDRGDLGWRETVK